jgi:hypothetical protein
VRLRKPAGQIAVEPWAAPGGRISRIFHRMNLPLRPIRPSFTPPLPRTGASRSFEPRPAETRVEADTKTAAGWPTFGALPTREQLTQVAHRGPL